VGFSIFATQYFAQIQQIQQQNKERFQEKQISCEGNALCLKVKVTKVVDGDTIYSAEHKIRLSLTNTPEIGEPGFEEATEFTRFFCPVGSVMIVDQDDGQPVDDFGRMLGKVTCNGKNLNEQLLEGGFGEIDTRFCTQSEFSDESWAKNHGC